MRPISERWPKPILPIDGRPVVATLLRDLAAAGCDDVTVVTGHLAEQVERLLGDGSAFGVRIRYVRQPRRGRLGRRRAPRARRGRGSARRSSTGADHVFARGTIESFLAAWGDAPGAVAARRGEPPLDPRVGAVLRRRGRPDRRSALGPRRASSCRSSTICPGRRSSSPMRSPRARAMFAASSSRERAT